jgi:YggT family protein
VLAPFRRLVPNLGGMDISPIFAFIAIQVIQSFLMPQLAAYAGMPQELWRMI